jgi:hypothetical protein
MGRRPANTHEHHSVWWCQPPQSCHSDKRGISRTSAPAKIRSKCWFSESQPSMSGRSILCRDDNCRWLRATFGGLVFTRGTRDLPDIGAAVVESGRSFSRTTDRMSGPSQVSRNDSSPRNACLFETMYSRERNQDGMNQFARVLTVTGVTA